MYALCRLQSRSETWYWRVYFKRRGTSYSKRFYDSIYGSSAKAKKAAIAWRDEQLSLASSLTLVDFCQQVRDNNTSGVPGVYFLRPSRQPEGIWQAKLKIAGKDWTKNFSILRYGNKKAYQLAVTARNQFLERARGQDRLYLYDELAEKKAPEKLPSIRKSNSVPAD